ncbi:hypothetical protein CEXT_214752, partial [Caerostris extrusa]
CNCGDGFKSCSFEGQKQLCECEPEYGLKEGKCEKCNCGDGFKSCSFEGQKQLCECEPEYGLKEGKCESNI